MNTGKTNRIAVVILMAVISVGLFVGGCVTKRDIEDLRGRLQRVEDQNLETQRLVSRMDSIIATGAEADNRLRVDVRTSIDDITRQIAQLLENYNDLISRMDQLSRQPEVIKLPPRSSSGSQPESSAASTTQGEAPTQTQAYDCIDSYDEAFTRVRKSEYEAAIEDFREFLKSCSDHENADNAFYWIAECYYGMEQYSQAIAELDTLLARFPTSEKLAPALYKLARSKQELGQTDEARQLFGQIVEEFSGTLEAEQARERLKDLE